MHCRTYRTAVRMAEYHHQFGSKMIRRVFHASQLMMIHHVTGHANRKQFTDACTKNGFRDHP